MNILKNCTITVRKSLVIAGKDLKILSKDRGQLAVLFLLPFLLAMFYGGGYAANRDPVTTSGETRLSIRAVIVNQDSGPYGAQVVEVLKDIEALEIRTISTVEAADEKVADGEIPAAIIIPTNFSADLDANQPTRIQLIKDPTRQVEARIAAGILNEVLTELNVQAEVGYGIRAVYEKTGSLAGADPETARAVQAQTLGVIWTAVQDIRRNPAIQVQVENQPKEQVALTTSGAVFGAMMPAFATMFAFFLVGTMAESILREKQAGSFRRLLAAPIPTGSVVTGKMLAYIGVVFLQMVVLLGISSLFLDMPLGRSPLALFILTLVLALAASSLGMLIGAIARTSKQAGSIGLLTSFTFFLASGVTSIDLRVIGGVLELSLPTEGFRGFIAQLTPNIHALNGYTALFLHGAGLADILPQILTLLGFATLFFMVAMWRFRFE